LPTWRHRIQTRHSAETTVDHLRKILCEHPWLESVYFHSGKNCKHVPIMESPERMKIADGFREIETTFRWWREERSLNHCNHMVDDKNRKLLLTEFNEEAIKQTGLWHA
jgi:hypothetical protein